MPSTEIPDKVPARLIVSDTAISKKPAGVPLIPLHIIWPDKSDQLDSEFSENPEDFYQKMQNFMDKGLGLPTTAQPSRGEFIKFYTTLYERGAREIGSVHIIASKSGTFGNAEAAAGEVMAKYPDMKIKAMDSGALSLLQMFQVETAVSELEKGTDLEKINDILLRNAKENMSFYVALRSLKNAVAGGRVKGLAAQASKWETLKVIVHLRNGELDPQQLALGMKPALQRIVNNVRDGIEQRKALPSHLGVMYTRDIGTGEQIEKMLEDIMKEPAVKFTNSTEAGALLGIHAGAGAGALTALWATT